MMLLSQSAVPGVYKRVAALESIDHDHHAKNIRNIIGEPDTRLYLTNIRSDKHYEMALMRIRDGHEKIVNLSLQSCYPTIQEELIIKQMIRKGKVVIVAAGNSDYKCLNIYPASYNIKGLIVVATPDGHQKNADIILPNDYHCYPKNKCLRGSSQATARVSNMALKMLKRGMATKDIIDILDKK